METYLKQVISKVFNFKDYLFIVRLDNVVMVHEQVLYLSFDKDCKPNKLILIIAVYENVKVLVNKMFILKVSILIKLQNIEIHIRVKLHVLIQDVVKQIVILDNKVSLMHLKISILENSSMEVV